MIIFVPFHVVETSAYLNNYNYVSNLG